MDNIGGVVLIMIVALAIMGGIGWASFLLLREYCRLPSNLRGHLTTAMVWTAITGFQTESLLIYRHTPNIVGHMVVFVAGWIMVSSWQQFAERKRGESCHQAKRPLFFRYIVQTLWGPLALWGCVWSFLLGQS